MIRPLLKIQVKTDICSKDKKTAQQFIVSNKWF